MDETRKGQILWGINNIFSVTENDSKKVYECRIKGKVLGCSSGEYNPLAPGDIVWFSISDEDQALGMIHKREERKNAFVRWNIKKKRPQTIAANLDGIYCLASPKQPPFRPRFIDRVSVAAQHNGIPFGIILNKFDQGIDDETALRLSVYRDLGIELLICSAETGHQLKKVAKALKGRNVAFFGQSGVGKSTLINALLPDARQKTAEVSQKYNRGRHTTNYSVFLPQADGGGIVDTPGVRDFALNDIHLEELAAFFPEFHMDESCAFQPCTHSHEPKCRVKELVESGDIHHDRYESYLRILEELQ